MARGSELQARGTGWARHRHRGVPGPDIESERVLRPDTESAGARRRDRRAPTKSAPGPAQSRHRDCQARTENRERRDTKSAGQAPTQRARGSGGERQGSGPTHSVARHRKGYTGEKYLGGCAQKRATQAAAGIGFIFCRSSQELTLRG